MTVNAQSNSADFARAPSPAPRGKKKFLFISICLVCLGRSVQLNNALVEHGIRHFDKSGNVCADDKVTRLTVLLCSFPGILEDRRHDVAQTGVDDLQESLGNCRGERSAG